MIAGCARLDIYGLGGGSAAIGEDAKLRFFRLGLPVCAYADGHQQRMSAATLRPRDVAFAISNSGRSKAVVGAIEIARSYGATTIALTRPDTPLAVAAEIVIPIAIAEDANALLPTTSRYAHMAVIDTIATGRRVGNGRALARIAAPRALYAGEHRRRHPLAVLRSDAADEIAEAAGMATLFEERRADAGIR